MVRLTRPPRRISCSTMRRANTRAHLTSRCRSCVTNSSPRSAGPPRFGPDPKRTGSERYSNSKRRRRLTAKKADTPQFKCPECGLTFTYANTLGYHRKKKHGVAGTSPAAVYAQKRKREAAAAEAAALQEQPARTKRKYTKRSDTLATLTPSKNGHRAQAEDHNGYSSGALETAVAVAFGRFTELCKSVASEFDVPPRTFTAQLALFISRAHTQIR